MTFYNSKSSSERSAKKLKGGLVLQPALKEITDQSESQISVCWEFSFLEAAAMTKASLSQPQTVSSH